MLKGFPFPLTKKHPLLFFKGVRLGRSLHAFLWTKKQITKFQIFPTSISRKWRIPLMEQVSLISHPFSQDTFASFDWLFSFRLSPISSLLLRQSRSSWHHPSQPEEETSLTAFHWQGLDESLLCASKTPSPNCPQVGWTVFPLDFSPCCCKSHWHPAKAYARHSHNRVIFLLPFCRRKQQKCSPFKNFNKVQIPIEGDSVTSPAETLGSIALYSPHQEAEANTEL